MDARLELSPEDVSLVARARPDLVAGCVYDDGELEGSEVAIQSLLTYLGSPAWIAVCASGLDALKITLCAGIDAAAEVERGKYITLGAGQAMTYQSKAAEALALATDPSPDPANYPLLAAEVGVTAEDLAGVGRVVRERQAAWSLMGAAIERARLAAKKAVTDAATAEEATAAANVTWPG